MVAQALNADATITMVKSRHSRDKENAAENLCIML
jgi:hypothetical protein